MILNIIFGKISSRCFLGSMLRYCNGQILLFSLIETIGRVQHTKDHPDETVPTLILLITAQLKELRVFIVIQIVWRGIIG